MRSPRILGKQAPLGREGFSARGVGSISDWDRQGRAQILFYYVSERSMKALAMFPFADGFKAVYRAMERACSQYQVKRKPTNDCDPRLAEVVCENIGQRAGPTFDIVKQLLEAIKCADFCIADLTGNNMNVLYELGFAAALEKPIIMLTQDVKSLGFDVRGMKAIEYDRENLDETLEK